MNTKQPYELEESVDYSEIPIINPTFTGQVDYKKNKIESIQFDKLSELGEDMLESTREWLQEILDNWPNAPRWK